MSKAGQTKSFNKAKIMKALGVSDYRSLDRVLKRHGLELPTGKKIITPKEAEKIYNALGIPFIPIN